MPLLPTPQIIPSTSQSEGTKCSSTSKNTLYITIYLNLAEDDQENDKNTV